MQIGRKLELTPRAGALQDTVRDLLLRIDSTIGAPPAFDPQGSDRTFRLFASDYTQFVLGPKQMTLAAQQKAGVRFVFAPLRRHWLSARYVPSHGARCPEPRCGQVANPRGPS